MAKRLVSIPDDVDQRLKDSVPSGQISSFISEQIERGLNEQGLHSLDDAIAHIAMHDVDLLNRLGNVDGLDA